MQLAPWKAARVFTNTGTVRAIPLIVWSDFDPGRKRFHRRCVSDYPLDWLATELAEEREALLQQTDWPPNQLKRERPSCLRWALASVNGWPPSQLKRERGQAAADKRPTGLQRVSWRERGQAAADKVPTGLCVRCCRDKHVPKMCSSANNMDPGPLPPQLQVGTYTSCK